MQKSFKRKKAVLSLLLSVFVFLSTMMPAYAADEDRLLSDTNESSEQIEGLAESEALETAETETANAAALNQRADSTGVTYYDGIYEGIGPGRNGDIKVKVTITDGKIASVEVIEQNETPSYWEKLKDFPNAIVEAQSTDIEGVSGATQSSDGIKAAVNDALVKAQTDPEGPYASGSGTEKDPYLIMTARQLAKFALTVDEGESYEGKYVALGADIDLADIETWNPIGTEEASASAKKFAGNFDGKGYTINNMTIALNELATETNVGLFSVLAVSSDVKNVNLRDVNIEINGTGSGALRAGGIAGDVDGGSGGKIDNTVPAPRLLNNSVVGEIKVATTGDAQVFAGGLCGRMRKALADGPEQACSRQFCA